jgi:hypothetical protein
LKVSFQASETIAKLNTDFLPVGWFWHANASTPAAVCEMVREEKPGDTERSVKHKMLDGS